MKVNEGGLKASLSALEARAADLGIREAWKLGAHTPREIEMIFRAESGRRQRQAEEADLQAWLTGRYVLSAIHAPKRFPRRPDAVGKVPRKMTDVEMKAAFMAMTGKGGTRHGGD